MTSDTKYEYNIWFCNFISSSAQDEIPIFFYNIHIYVCTYNCVLLSTRTRIRVFRTNCETRHTVFTYKYQKETTMRRLLVGRSVLS